MLSPSDKPMRSWSYLSIYSKCIEPRKRMVGGVWGWASHKYPIKGGISHRLAMIADLCEPRNGMLFYVVSPSMYDLMFGAGAVQHDLAMVSEPLKT